MKCKLLAIIILIILLTGCRNNLGTANDNIDYDKYLILGKTEEQYINSIKNALEYAYAPQPGVSEKHIEKVLSEYMTKDCIDLFTTKNESSTVKPGDVKCKVKQIDYAYGQHQIDGIPRVIAAIRVETNNHYWEFVLEMKLNNDDLIYEVEAY